MSEWIGLLTCNECADYESMRRTLERLITDQCVSWFRIDWASHHNEIKPDKCEQLRKQLFSNLVTLTKRYTSLICHRYKVVDAWECDFVQILMDNPQQAQKYLWGYIKVTSAAARRTTGRLTALESCQGYGEVKQ